MSAAAVDLCVEIQDGAHIHSSVGARAGRVTLQPCRV